MEGRVSCFAAIVVTEARKARRTGGVLLLLDTTPPHKTPSHVLAFFVLSTPPLPRAGSHSNARMVTISSWYYHGILLECKVNGQWLPHGVIVAIPPPRFSIGLTKLVLRSFKVGESLL